MLFNKCVILNTSSRPLVYYHFDKHVIRLLFIGQMYDNLQKFVVQSIMIYIISCPSKKNTRSKPAGQPGGQAARRPGGHSNSSSSSSSSDW